MKSRNKFWNGDIRFVEVYRKNTKRATQFFAADDVVCQNSINVFYLNGSEVGRCNEANCFYKAGPVVNFFVRGK